MVSSSRDRGSLRIARNCWIHPSLMGDLAARCHAALQSSADYTVVASMTAAVLQHFWVPDDRSIHLATATPERVGRAMTRTRRPEFVAHRFQLRDTDITTVGGLLVTSPARTWRDLACVLPLADLVAAGDSILRLGTSLDELADVISRTPRRPFTALARRAFGLLDARSESRPESHMRVAISGGDLPRFEVNATVSRTDGGFLGVPDLSLERARIGLEYQGADHAKVDRMRRDITRFGDFRRDGWLMLPYGPAEVFGRPWEIRTETRRAIVERAPQLLVGGRRRTPIAG